MARFTGPDFENCLVKDQNADDFRTIKYTIRNCSQNSYCCDNGCCSILWYTGPLAIFLVITLICCITCIKAAWDVYNEGITSEHPNEITEMRVRNPAQIVSPPPAYNVAIFLPQPSQTRVPTYEEVMRES